MALLPLKYMGDRVLRKKSESVEGFDPALDRLIDDMIETMYHNRGIGLAGPQVGVSKQIFVFDNIGAPYGTDPRVLINPVVAASDGQETDEEGCLSIPEIKEQIERSLWIKVLGLDRMGKEIEIEADHLAARVMQHEIDHLEGRLFVDRVSSVKRNLINAKWKKIRQDLLQGPSAK